MVTGDHPTTATAIARKVGLINTVTREEIATQRGLSTPNLHHYSPMFHRDCHGFVYFVGIPAKDVIEDDVKAIVGTMIMLLMMMIVTMLMPMIVNI